MLFIVTLEFIVNFSFAVESSTLKIAKFTSVSILSKSGEPSTKSFWLTVNIKAFKLLHESHLAILKLMICTYCLKFGDLGISINQRLDIMPYWKFSLVGNGTQVHRIEVSHGILRDVEGHELGIIVVNFACLWNYINRILDRVKALFLRFGLLD